MSWVLAGAANRMVRPPNASNTRSGDVFGRGAHFFVRILALAPMRTRDQKFVEGFPKPGEGKSKSLGRKFKARGSEIKVSFFHESGLFKGLRANPNCEPLFSPNRPSAAGAGARGRAKTHRRNASSQGLSCACFARAVPQSMPASLPAALAAF